MRHLLYIAYILLFPLIGWSQDQIDTTAYVQQLIRASDKSMSQRNIGEAIPKIEEAWAIIQGQKDFDTELSELVKYKYVLIISRAHRCDEAQKLANEILPALTEKVDSVVQSKVSLLLALGDCYRRDELDTAITYYQHARTAHEDQFKERSALQGSIYNKLGIAYKNKGEYELSIEFYNKTLDVWRQVFPGKNSRIGSILANIGMLQATLGKYDLAEKTHLESIENDIAEIGPDHPFVSSTYTSLGSIYKRLGNYDRALEYQFKALKIRQRNYPPNDRRIYVVLNNLALVYERIPDYEKAIEYFESALEIVIHNYGEKGSDVAIACDNLANVLTETKQFEKSLTYHQRALNALSDGSEVRDIYLNPELESFPQHGFAHKHIGGKALSMLKKYKFDGDEKALTTSLETFDLLFAYIDQRKTLLDNESSQLAFSDFVYYQYGNAIDASYQGYLKDKDPIFVQKALEYAELSKSFQLLAAFRNEDARIEAGIPKELQLKEDQLSEKVAVLRNQMQDVTTGKDIHPDTVRDHRERYIEAQLELADFKADLKSNYPDYYALKFGQETIRTNELMTDVLNENEMLIEYHLDGNQLSLLAFDKTVSDFHFMELDTSSLHAIDTFRSILLNKDVNVKEYVTIANQVYTILLGKISDRISGKDLIIVPSGVLNYIPFEALVTKSGDELQPEEYRKVSYLLEEHQVSYAFSATLFAQNRATKKSDKPLSYLGFAPEFNEIQAIDKPILASAEMSRITLAPLKGAAREIEEISQKIFGKKRIGRDASETKFKSEAGKYGVIHLATHAILDNDNSLRSRLLFSEVDGSEDDGDLNAWEIYNLKLKAKLAVLSACNTGSGKIQRGEGVMSLGRAFAYAGCPSTIMSLWPANDQSTLQVISRLFDGLSKGQNKAEALRLSKIEYIEQAQGYFAHPFYWAGFVLQGDKSSLKFVRQPVIPPWAGILVIVLLGALLFLRIRNGSPIRPGQ